MILDPLRACDDVRWSALVTDLDRGPLDALDADRVLPTASVGKVFLLVTVADLIERGVLDPTEELEPTAADAVGDSGLLQHVARRRLPVADLAVLVGAVSDNLATNVLLRRVGLDEVAATTTRLGISHSALADAVRDERRPGIDAPTLSYGSATELAGLVGRLDRGTLVSQEVSQRVRRWLAGNVDLSMVAAAFGLDPLAHLDRDHNRGIELFDKTGTDDGTRADVGVVALGARRIAFAVIAHWEDDEPGHVHRVLGAMRAVGDGILRVLTAG